QYDTSIGADAGGSTGQSIFRAITDFSFNLNSGEIASTGFTRSGTPPPSNIQMYNDQGSPDFDHISIVPFAPELQVPGSPTFFFNFAVLRLDDTGETVFNTADALPTSLNLSDFSGGNFDLFFLRDEGDGSFETKEVDAVITSLSTTVSEPT